MAYLKEIRWHGRGGQGAKTAATLIGQIALHEGKYGQGFPEYGPERMGAPIRGFTRISEAPIMQHCAIEFPDIVMVLDATLMDTVDVCENIKDGGVVIVNTNMSVPAVRAKLSNDSVEVWTVDATGIALAEIGRPIPNTAIMGALVKATGILKLETVIKDLKIKFGSKFSQKIIDANVKAVERAYEEVCKDEN